jgi:hypothetical protein
MKVCTHNGIDVAVFTSPEHCPPHVHAGADGWDARFEFSFWHNGVNIWDVKPKAKAPKQSTLEAIRLVVENPVNLAKARTLWWDALRTVCLNNKYFDPKSFDVVDGKSAKKGFLSIQSSEFDERRNSTVVYFANDDEPLEFKL